MAHGRQITAWDMSLTTASGLFFPTLVGNIVRYAFAHDHHLTYFCLTTGTAASSAAVTTLGFYLKREQFAPTGEAQFTRGIGATILGTSFLLGFANLLDSDSSNLRMLASGVLPALFFMLSALVVIATSGKHRKHTLNADTLENILQNLVRDTVAWAPLTALGMDPSNLRGEKNMRTAVTGTFKVVGITALAGLCFSLYRYFWRKEPATVVTKKFFATLTEISIGMVLWSIFPGYLASLFGVSFASSHALLALGCVLQGIAEFLGQNREASAASAGLIACLGDKNDKAIVKAHAKDSLSHHQAGASWAASYFAAIGNNTTLVDIQNNLKKLTDIGVSVGGTVGSLNLLSAHELGASGLEQAGQADSLLLKMEAASSTPHTISTPWWRSVFCWPCQRRGNSRHTIELA